jgi:carbonic anhydrase/acetyltransferase-like protein (isoleucine patch superfamily)
MGDPPLVHPLVRASPGALVCADVRCEGGRVTFGPGCVVQPRCVFRCERGAAGEGGGGGGGGGEGDQLGSIHVGSDVIFEEQCEVVHFGPGALEIGALSLFEAGCTLRGAARVGSGTTVGARAEVGRGAVLGSHVVVAAASVVAPGAVVADGTAVMQDGKSALTPRSAKAHREHMSDYLSALRDPHSRTALVNFHALLS